MANRLVELILQAIGDESQREFALNRGLSASAINRILNGQRVPSPDTLRAISKKAHNSITYEQLMDDCGRVYLVLDK